MAARSKSTKSTKSTKTSDLSDVVSAPYVSPLEKLVASVTKPGRTASSTKSVATKASVVKDSFKARLIPLDNGIEDSHYDDLPELSLPSPPPPPQSPPLPPPVIAKPPPLPQASVPSASASSLHGMMREGFKSMSKDLGDSFANTMGRLNNSLLKGLEGLRDHMTSVSNGEQEYDEEPDEEYEDQEMEDGEVRENHDRQDVPEAVVSNSLTQLAATISKEDALGDKVDEKLAEIVQVIMRSKPEEKVVGDLFTSIKQPANCSALAQIVVNPPIWDKMSQDGRSLDAKYQKIQLAIIKGTTELTRMYDMLLTMSRNGVEEASQALIHGNNALVSLGAANVDLVQRRRDAMKSSFDSEYNHLFNHNTQFTNFLFGDDLSKNIKEITEDNKLLSSVVRSSKQSFRGKPYARGQATRSRGSYPRTRASRGRQNFGQDRPQTYRRQYPSRDSRSTVRRGTSGRRN